VAPSGLPRGCEFRLKGYGRNASPFRSNTIGLKEHQPGYKRRTLAHIAKWPRKHAGPASPACLNAARGQPADAKVAENLETIAAIPRHALGKADRKALVEMLVQRRGSAGA
jgi:hypothetical protein